MNKKYIPTFGVEIHAELLTKTKAFSNALVDFDSKPNYNVKPVDLGYPGAKPTVNKKMVEYAYRLAKILRMDISELITFDRKSYFYPDLPKGFQITQYYKPIGENGTFEIIVNGKQKTISITEIHMEEDTAKQTKTNEGTLLDFNRSGVPLIEIVSGHKELSSIDDVLSYVKTMRDQLVIMGINDGKLEEGSFRVDVNVSIRPEDQKEYGTRTEIKNLNSFNNIKKALKHEIERHQKIYESGKILESTTVRYDEDSEQTFPMRVKDSNNDYNFIPEGNITPIKLIERTIENFEKNGKNDIEIINFYNKWLNVMTDVEMEVITSSKVLYDLFNNLIKNSKPKKIINFIVNDIKHSLNNYKSKNPRISIENIENILILKNDGKIDSKKTNVLLLKSFDGDISKDIDELKNVVLISNEELAEIINKLIIENSEMIEKDKENRPERVEKFLMGQVMKITKGKVNPKESNKLIKKVLWES